MPIVEKMDHFTVLSGDLDTTREFYGLLGLTVGPRPNFAFPGLWLYSNGRPILHVIAADPMPAVPDGAIDHIAFRAQALGPTLEMLKARGVASKLMRLPSPYNVWQLFFRDPFGAMVELDFDPAEAAPEGWQETSRPQESLVPAEMA
jgi:catechol 2,3-dioxygenase-like lactoylglutathione lyase family enzyme